MNNQETYKKNSLDITETIKRIFKYLIIGLVVALAIKYVPSKNLTLKEIIIISIIVAVTFAILDMYN